jgi:hypothetical protein
MMPRKELEIIDDALASEELPERARNWLEARKAHVSAVAASAPRLRHGQRQQAGQGEGE